MISTIILVTLFLSNIHSSYQQTCTTLANTGSDSPYFATFTRIASAGDCCTICNNNPTCQFFTFTCGTCYLKATVGNIRASSQKTSGYRSNTAATTTTTTTAAVPTRAAVCIESANTNYPGNDIPNQGFGNIASSTDCCNLCGALADCTAYSYSPNDRYCWLKNPAVTGSDITGKIDVYQGYISGVLFARRRSS